MSSSVLPAISLPLLPGATQIAEPLPVGQRGDVPTELSGYGSRRMIPVIVLLTMRFRDALTISIATPSAPSMRLSTIRVFHGRCLTAQEILSAQRDRNTDDRVVRRVCERRDRGKDVWRAEADPSQPDHVLPDLIAPADIRRSEDADEDAVGVAIDAVVRRVPCRIRPRASSHAVGVCSRVFHRRRAATRRVVATVERARPRLGVGSARPGDGRRGAGGARPRRRRGCSEAILQPGRPLGAGAAARTGRGRNGGGRWPG